jgi:hypothetical protein
LTHALKGMVSNFSSQAANRVALCLETMAQEQDLSHTQEVYKELESIIERLTPELEHCPKTTDSNGRRQIKRRVRSSHRGICPYHLCTGLYGLYGLWSERISLCDFRLNFSLHPFEPDVGNLKRAVGSTGKPKRSVIWPIPAESPPVADPLSVVPRSFMTVAFRGYVPASGTLTPTCNVS